MRKAQIRIMLGAALTGLALLSTTPARSQYDPHDMLAAYSAPYARYYAPYALQASAAYINVNAFNNSDPSTHIELAAGDFRGVTSKKIDADGKPLDIFAKAKRYLRAWRYQFGSTCRRADPDCWLANSADRSKFEHSGPKFHVWARFPKKFESACNEVSIAFRGTTLSGADILADVNPVGRFFFDDHYSRLQRNIDALIARITRLPCYRTGVQNGAPDRTRIVSTGHSLGGGLAQFAALAGSGAVRIDKAFAFNSSPWTGAPMLDRDLLQQNTSVIEIDRVHEGGEILTWPRRLAQQAPSDSSPCVRRIEYRVIKPSLSPKKMHSMAGLAAGIVEASYTNPFPTLPEDQYRFKQPPSNGCASQYAGPANDDDDYDTAQPPATPPQIATRSSTARLTMANQSGMAVRYASRDGFEFSTQPEQAVAVLDKPEGSLQTRLAKAHRHKRSRIARR